MKISKKAKPLNEAFELTTDTFLPAMEYRHIYNKHVVCVTDARGYAQPGNKSLFDLRVDASDGFIPLWDKGVTLNWRFSKSFASYFKNPDAAKQGVKQLLGKAIAAWGAACPVKFKENNDAWDFEIDMHKEDCDASGCVLASAFFPNQGQNVLYIYPTLFKQPAKEQLETIEHEIGHIFGLRHFFANIEEKEWQSELFGKDNPFSVMNYGAKSILTPDDINDLKRLYEMVWKGQLTSINGTEIRKFVSYHMAK